MDSNYISSQEMVAPSSTARQSGMSLCASHTDCENLREETGLGRKTVSHVVEYDAFVRYPRRKSSLDRN